MAERYTAKDPHFQIWCSECRYGTHRCVGNIDLKGDSFIPDGKYYCGCTQCRFK